MLSWIFIIAKRKLGFVVEPFAKGHSITHDGVCRKVSIINCKRDGNYKSAIIQIMLIHILAALLFRNMGVRLYICAFRSCKDRNPQLTTHLPLSVTSDGPIVISNFD